MSAVLAPSAQEPAIQRIRATPRSGGEVLRELWEYRELLVFLSWRDVAVRYKQTILGLSWVLLQPLLTMAVFSLVFGRLARLPSDGVPYPLFVFCGLLPWQLFAFALGSSANSLVSNERLVTRVYFPRLLLPIAAVLAGLPDFALSLGVFALLMAYYGVALGWTALALPALCLLVLAAATALGVALAALNAQFRDVKHALPFLTQLWMFATPIAYSTSLLPDRWQVLWALNPLTGIVAGFRWALLGPELPVTLILVSGIITVLGLVFATLYFTRVESTLADVI
jgi:lipopolysaccharide transport system permease protein